MRIGIDIDDTLSESFELVFPFSQKFDIEELGNSGKVQTYGKKENHNYIEEMYPHWSEEQTDLFWEKIFMQTVTEARPKPYAHEIIHRLKEEGNQIVIITSRYEVLPNDNTIETKSKEWLTKNDIPYEKTLEIWDKTKSKEWLAKNDIPYDTFVLNAKDKLIAAQNEKIDLFIDDSIQHCRRVNSGGIKTLLCTTNANQGVEVPELERVYSWIQIYQIYKQMRDKK